MIIISSLDYSIEFLLYFQTGDMVEKHFELKVFINHILE